MARVIEMALAVEHGFFAKSRFGDAAKTGGDAEEEWSDLVSRRAGE